MADFERIQLIGKGSVGGAVLMLNAASDISRIVHLPRDIEVEVRRGVAAAVVRGMFASDYDSVMRAAPEQVNRALDICTMVGSARLALAGIWSNHVAWWSTAGATVARIWCSATIIMAAQGNVVVGNPDGTVRSAAVEITPSWHESMRYFRISEITDDLFDAFRNIYLALESLLSKLEPRKANEGEGAWLRRALKRANENVDLGAYALHSTGDPVANIYAELWTEIRNSVFHAKSTRASFLPQDLTSRTKVANAKSRYTDLYLDLIRTTYGSQFPSGGFRLSSSAKRKISNAATNGWTVGFVEDPSPIDDLSVERAEITTLPTERSTDPRGEDFSAVIAHMPVAKIPEAPVVGHIITFTSDGQRSFAQSLGGRLSLDGFDCCEFQVSVGVTGRQARKTLYAT